MPADNAASMLRRVFDFLAHLRCPDHGRFCNGADCCCRDLHWHPIRERWRWTRFDNYEAREWARLNAELDAEEFEGGYPWPNL